MNGLLTLVPTRNRVENALELLDVWYETTSESSSGLLFIIGTEDPRLSEYLHKLPYEHVRTFPERGLVKALNYVAPTFTREYEAIGFMGDDHRPRTVGWDSAYLRNLRELGDGYVYGNDLLMGRELPTQVAISSSIIEVLGFFGPPTFTHLYVDNTWKDMGEGLGRIRYLDDVVVEHMHPSAGKAQEDAGYQSVNSKAMVRRDEKAYRLWKKYSYERDVRHVADRLGIVLPLTLWPA